MILQSITKFSSGFDVKFTDVSEYELKALVDLAVSMLTENTKQDMPEIDGRKDSDGWIPWGGGECPIPKHGAGSFMVRFRSGGEECPEKLPASALRWWHCNDEDKYVLSQKDIVAYRLLTKP